MANSYKVLIGSFVLVLATLAPIAAWPATYQWTDEEGGIHFTDDPAKIPQRYLDQAEKRKPAPRQPTSKGGDASEKSQGGTEAPPSIVISEAPQELVLDGRHWEIGYRGEESGKVIVEYVLNGEAVENWSELLTWQFFQDYDQKYTVREFLDKLHAEKMRLVPGLGWKEYGVSDEDAVYSWTVEDDPVFVDQTYVGRIVHGIGGLHMIFYAIKKPLMEFDHNNWVEILRSLRVDY